MKENLETQAKETIKAKIKEQCIEQLTGMHEIELPKALVDQEIGLEKQRAMQNMQGVPEDALPSDLFEENARKRVTLGLVMGQIISEKEITLDAEKVDTYLAVSYTHLTLPTTPYV